jgi:hypothetical protein
MLDAIERHMDMNDGTASPQLTIAPASRVPCFTDSIPLSISFDNREEALVRMLDVFQPTPVFFSFEIVGEDGTPVILPGGGKIDFGPEPLRYRELKMGDAYTVTIDIADLLSGPLRPGAYAVSANYHNQYGDRCFRGIVGSNTITIRICEREEKP